MTHKEIYHLRQTYSMHSLDEKDVLSDPLQQFQVWLKEALTSEIGEAYAFTLATVSETGQPNARVVLLRSAEPEGFSFFTNYSSAKASEISSGGKVAMNFFWAALERQVRIHGSIQKLSKPESEAYFQTRPRESQIGAWVSNQSAEVPNRAFLEEKVKEYENLFSGKPIPKPENWGGYLIQPHYYEFWQGRPGRLHDRISYKQVENNHWKICRLSP